MPLNCKPPLFASALANRSVINTLSRWWRVAAGAHRGLLYLLLIGSLAVTACGGGGGGNGNPTPAPVGKLSGTLIDANTARALASVIVRVGNLSTQTDADGNYTLDNVPVGSAQVTFTAPGQATRSEVVTVSQGTTVRQDARLTPASTTTVAAGSAATVTAPGSTASVTLAANSLVVSGTTTAASGTVTARLAVIDPASNPANMPGSYQARLASGASTAIESFGAISIELTDSAGRPLNLASGQTATIRIPVSPRSTTPPASVPLFYFEDSSGLWIEQGSATLAGTAPNQYYEGTVSHFSYWNADQPLNTVVFNGCVRSGAGAALPGVAVTSSGSDYIGTSSALSAADGSFSLPVKRNGIANVSAQSGTGAQTVTSTVLAVGPSDVGFSSSTCLTLDTTPKAPSFVLQPAAQTTDAGSYAIFMGLATGAPTISYQWRRNGVDLPGQTHTYLLLFPVSSADDQASYTVVATNAVGSTVSSAAALTVTPAVPLAPQIGTQPASVSVTSGLSASFQVTAVSRGGSLSYQWRRNGTAISDGTGTGAVYTLSTTTLADSGASFDVVVSSSNGTQVTSSAAVLTVTAQPSLAISAQPQSVNVIAGQPATFSVVAGGVAPLTYQWSRNGSPIAAATGSSYTLAAATISDSGASYSVQVGDALNRAVTSATALLTVQDVQTSNALWYLTQSGGSGSPVQPVQFPFFDPSVPNSAQPLIAVQTSAPGAPVTVLPQGTTDDSYAMSLFEFSGSGSTLRFLPRRLVTIKTDGSFVQVDGRAASPTAVQMSSLNSSTVCSFLIDSAPDLVNSDRGWVLLTGPGNDRTCRTDDDELIAISPSMPATTPAINLGAAVRIANLNDGAGNLTGLLIKRGGQIIKVDSQLQNPVVVVAQVSSSFVNVGLVTSWVGGGLGLYRDDGSLWALDPANPGPPVNVAPADANARVLVAASGTDVYAGVSSDVTSPGLPVTTTTTVVRISATLQLETYPPLTGAVTTLLATPTRLIIDNGPFWKTSARTGAAAWTNLMKGQLAGVVNFPLVVDEDLWISRSNITTGLSDIAIFAADGSIRTNLLNSVMIAGVTSGGTGQLTDSSSTVAVLVMRGANVRPNSQTDAGNQLVYVDGPTAAPSRVLGTLPATPAGSFSADTLGFMVGDTGLVSYTAFVGNTISSELFLLTLDPVAGALTAVTNLPGAAQAPAASKVRLLGAPALHPARPQPVIPVSGRRQLAPQAR